MLVKRWPLTDLWSLVCQLFWRQSDGQFLVSINLNKKLNCSWDIFFPEIYNKILIAYIFVHGMGTRKRWARDTKLMGPNEGQILSLWRDQLRLKLKSCAPRRITSLHPRPHTPQKKSPNKIPVKNTSWIKIKIN